MGFSIVKRIDLTKKRTIGCNFKVSINVSVNEMAYQLKDSSNAESKARNYLQGLQRLKNLWVSHSFLDPLLPS